MSRGAVVEARYPTKCPACGEWIHEGDEIVCENGEWIHAECTDELEAP